MCRWKYGAWHQHGKKNVPFDGRSFLMGYLFETKYLKYFLRITGSSFDFTKLTAAWKNEVLNQIAKYKVQSSINNNLDQLYSSANNGSKKVILSYILSFVVTGFTDRIVRWFVPKFYHNRKEKNFLKGLKYVGEKTEIDENGFSEFPSTLGRKLYEYRIGKDRKVISIHPNNLDWPFPDIWYKTIGFTINGFSLKFKNIPTDMANILDPSPQLINKENNVEQVDNTLTQDQFTSNKKDIDDKIKEFNAIPTKNYIKESFFYMIKVT